MHLMSSVQSDTLVAAIDRMIALRDTPSDIFQIYERELFVRGIIQMDGTHPNLPSHRTWIRPLPPKMCGIVLNAPVVRVSFTGGKVETAISATKYEWIMPDMWWSKYVLSDPQNSKQYLGPLYVIPFVAGSGGVAAMYLVVHKHFLYDPFENALNPLTTDKMTNEKEFQGYRSKKILFIGTKTKKDRWPPVHSIHQTPVINPDENTIAHIKNTCTCRGYSMRGKCKHVMGIDNQYKATGILWPSYVE